MSTARATNEHWVPNDASRSPAVTQVRSRLTISVQHPAMTLIKAYLRTWQYYRDDWGKILVSILLVGLTSFANLLQPFPFAVLIDSVLMHRVPERLPHRLFARYGPHDVVTQIIVLASLTILLRIISEGVGLAQGFYKIRIGYNG